MAEIDDGIRERYVDADNIDGALGEWMRQVEPYQWRAVEPLRVAEAALLVVDMTKPFVEDEDRPLCSPSARFVVGRISELADAFRATDRPVIWLVQGHHSVAHDRGDHLSAWWPAPLLEGTSDVEMASGLAVPPGEKVIVKRRYSGFYQTDLEVTLRCLGITQVVICGTLTHVCPLATAFDAFMRDLTVYFPADGTASLNRRLHLMALQTVAGWCGHVVRTRELLDWLSAQSQEK